MLLKGTILGHYRLLQRIGVGGMGEVYLAEDTRIPRQVAVKVVRIEAEPYPNSAAVQEASRLFQREMRAIATLDHRNILNLIDFGEETIEGMPTTYMIMPYRKEGSLNDWLQRYKTQELLSLDDIDHILSQAAAALQHAHDHQIIHQDVKPANFLIRENSGNPGRPDLLLTDFGVAKLTNATATASQHVRGTPAYMSPEQWESEPVPATDQYALAVMAYLFLTGRTPFEGRMEQVMRQHLMVAPQPPSAYNPRLSPAIDAVILQALAKKPEERFPSIEDFARAFHQAIQYTGDLRTTLTITTDEATTGVKRSITLPGGRKVSITVPSNAQDGQELHVENQGDAFYEGGPRGSLLLKVAVSPEQATSVSKNDKANIPATNAAPLEPATQTSQKQSDLLPPIEAVPPPSPLEPKTGPVVAQTSSSPVEPTTKPTAARTTPTTSEKTDKEKWVMPPLSSVGSTSSLPLSSSIPERRARKPVVTVISLVAVIALVVAGIVGIIHQSNVSVANANATATTSTLDANAIATATANVYGTEFANARATVNGGATASANDSANAQATANANPDPYGAGGTLSKVDSLTQDAGYFSAGGFCGQVMSDGYHITDSSCNSASLGLSFDNFVFEVKMTINRGDCGGMTLRYVYTFYVCSDGTYQFLVSTLASSAILKSGSNSGITAVQSIIAVVASESNFTLYLNHKQLDSVSDSTDSSGPIGLIAGSTNNNSSTTTEVTYRDVRIWTL